MKSLAPIAAALSLVACNSEPEVSLTNATAEQVQEEVAQAGGTAEFVSPGKWESRVRFETFEMPGMPSGAGSVLDNLNAQNQVHSTCLTPEQAKRPKEDFFAGGSKDCRYDKFTMGGGRIDAAMTCGGQGGAQKMTMQGTYSDDSYTMRMNMEGGEGSPMAGAKMTMRVDAKRVGNCDGTENG